MEVAAAIRPAGHVLQVSNGKGASFDTAARGAVMEAAELWGAERPVVAAFAAARDLGDRAILPAAIHRGALAGGEAARIAWTAGRELENDAPVLVPSYAVFCPPPGSALLGPPLVRWTSNGMAAHPDPDAALLHALLEVIERDQLARALPHGFTLREVRRRLVAHASLSRGAPRTAARVRDLEARGFRVHLLDLAPRLGSDHALDLALPCAAAILVDRAGSPVPLTAGYACRLDADAAFLAALLEAAQSRLTEIHGAREDVFHGRDDAAPLAAWCAATRPARAASALPRLRARSASAAAGAIAGRLGRAGLRAAAVDLPAPPGIHVVKVLVPDLLLSELL